MRLYRRKEHPALKWAAAVLLFAVLIGAVIYVTGQTSENGGEQARAAAENAIRKAAINCYAIEGAYPGTVTYLEDNYGIVIDHQKYVVDYNSIGNNIMPNIEVIVRGTNAF